MDHRIALSVRRWIGAGRRFVSLRRRGWSPFFRRFPCPQALPLVDSRALVSIERRFVYFRVPKAANSAIVASLLAEDHELHRDAVERLKNSGPRLSSLNARQVDAIIDDYRLFVFVRNPFARIYSCYLDKVVRAKPEAAKVRAFLNKEIGECVSFNDFLDFLEKGNNIYSDGHWARQSDLVPVPLGLLDFIGSVENFEQDFSRLLEVLDYGPRVGRCFAPHATGANDRLYEIERRQAARIVRLYERDFEVFGYSKDFDPAKLARKR